MFLKTVILIICCSRTCYSDWISDWLTPVQDEFGTVKDLNYRRNDDADLKMFEDEELRLTSTQDPPNTIKVPKEVAIPEVKNFQSSASLKMKLEMALEKAKELAETLRVQILAVAAREAMLKEAIANGRSGVSSVIVHTLDRAPRSYLIRDGYWTLCNGVVQPPTDGSYSKISGPQCLGLEMSSKPDPCVFNSIIKYETIPTRRHLEYTEENYLCLKGSFNTTIAKYLSVPKRVVNETCTNGTVRSLEDNVAECGYRVLSEYAYYPGTAPVPLEYCPGGVCRLIAAWHISNATIQNFEYLKDDQSFKKFFVKDGYSDRLIS